MHGLLTYLWATYLHTYSLPTYLIIPLQCCCPILKIINQYLNICKDFVKFGVINHNTIVNIFETFAKMNQNPLEHIGPCQIL
jgi:hypothetical protein